MIVEADREKLTALHTTDPFYTRILSLYESYGGGYDFVDYWVQETDGRTVSAISRFEDKFSLYLTENSDLEEVAAFLRFQGAGAVMTDSRYTLELMSEQVISGQVLRYAGEYYNSESELYTPEIKPLYALLQSCESDIFRVPEYMSFLSDVTHRRNLGKCAIMATNVGGAIASAVMTVSETESAAILGAVATHPDFRRRGLSRELVRTLASRITSQGRAAYVFSASVANTRFYQNSGFEICAEFTEYMTPSL
ncbi:MAG: GNAT family N-acetyltransferase [Ruminococcus sp.]|nr:GNAT family N-acetyltransferase [Ruminococcus sp.]